MFDDGGGGADGGDGAGKEGFVAFVVDFEEGRDLADGDAWEGCSRWKAQQ